MRSSLLRTYLLLVLTATIWGGAFIAGKISTEQLHPVSVAFFRFLGASMVLFPFMLWKEPLRLKPSKKDWLMFGVLGLTGIFLYNVCFFIATKYAPLVKSSLVIAVNGPLIALLSTLLLKEKMTKEMLAGIAIAFAGAVYVISDGDFGALFQTGLQPVDLVLIAASLSWSLYSVFGKVVMTKYSPLVTTTYSAGIGTLMLLPFALFHTSWRDIQTSGWEVWASLLYVAVLVSAISFIWWYQGIKKAGASKASVFINIMPISASVMAALFFDEKLTAVHGIGAFLIFGGIFIIVFANKNSTVPVNVSTSKMEWRGARDEPL